MTPAIDSVKKAKIEYKIHEYEHDPSNQAYGDEASDKMGIAKERIFKTLVVSLGEKEFGVGLVPVSSQLNLKQIAKALGSKKAAMAQAADVERITGYVLGGVSPLGQKKRLKMVIDSSAMQFSTIFISAGRRGLELEFQPEDLRQLTSAVVGDICSL